MKSNTKTAQPMLRRILIPMVLLTLVEVILLGCVFIFSGTMRTLDKNEQNVVHGKVATRAEYLQNEMLNNWSNVSYTAQSINQLADELSANGTIQLSTIGESSSENDMFTQQIAYTLIDMLRTNKLTGAFVILNTENPDLLSKQDTFESTGICLRDLDPTTAPSEQNNDLLIKRGSIELVQSLGVATAGSWMPKFRFTKTEPNDYEILMKPLEQAYANPNAESLTELGYWSRPHILCGDDKSVVSYTVPLIASDGTVYGVLGTEITLDYLSTALPGEELMEDGTSGYLLIIKDTENDKYRTVFSSNPTITQDSDNLHVKTSSDGTLNFTGNDKKDYYLDIKELKLYDSNGPFESDQWGVAGIVRERDLTQFSRRILSYIVLVIIFTILIGTVGSIVVSFMISKPIQQVSRHMNKMDRRKQIHLPRTNILEFDQLEKSIEKLSRDVIDSGTKFAQILDKASIRIAGVDIDVKYKDFFITDGFFSILGNNTCEIDSMDIEGFWDEMRMLDVYKEEEGDDYTLYKIPDAGKHTYIRLNYSQPSDGRYVGVIEDITKSILEKQSVEHERDHDLLTGLKNRRAFHRIMQNLFVKGDATLKKAALVMMDLDNLKHINDRYGHDYGDKYIQTAAKCFRKYTPENTLICRNSGDEFFLFLYGYESEEEIEVLLKALRQGIDSESVTLPSNQMLRLRMSGGISWYPKDTIHHEKLLQYSDFAMYQVKHSTKGALGNFDLGAYHSEEYILQSKRELVELLHDKKVEFYFQPIIDAHTGVVFAYEALMRGLMPTLRYPSEILSLARAERKLLEIEELTWEVALNTFHAHIEHGRISSNCKAFINSLPDHIPSNQVIQQLEASYKESLSNIVIEITEAAEIDGSILNEKRILLERWNTDFALDDYGSGYNGEKVLIQLSPKYIKIDREIISEIQLNADKQKLFSNTVSYATERNIKVIAEGVETAEEMQKVIELGADYLQGYYLAQPALEPPKISECVYFQITHMSKNL